MDTMTKYSYTYYPRIFPKGWKCVGEFNGYLLANNQYPTIVIQVDTSHITILNKDSGRSVECYNWLEDISDIATNRKVFMRLFKSLKK